MKLEIQTGKKYCQLKIGLKRIEDFSWKLLAAYLIRDKNLWPWINLLKLWINPSRINWDATFIQLLSRKEIIQRVQKMCSVNLLQKNRYARNMLEINRFFSYVFAWTAKYLSMAIPGKGQLWTTDNVFYVEVRCITAHKLCKWCVPLDTNYLKFYVHKSTFVENVMNKIKIWEVENWNGGFLYSKIWTSFRYLSYLV